MKTQPAFEMQRPVVDDHAVVEETIEQCVLADRMGFDAVWFVEHHFLTSFSMSPVPGGDLRGAQPAHQADPLSDSAW